MFCHLCDDMEIKLIGFSVNSAEGQRSALKPNCTAKTGRVRGGAIALDRNIPCYHHFCGDQDHQNHYLKQDFNQYSKVFQTDYDSKWPFLSYTSLLGEGSKVVILLDMGL